MRLCILKWSNCRPTIRMLKRGLFSTNCWMSALFVLISTPRAVEILKSTRRLPSVKLLIWMPPLDCWQRAKRTVSLWTATSYSTSLLGRVRRAVSEKLSLPWRWKGYELIWIFDWNIEIECFISQKVYILRDSELMKFVFNKPPPDVKPMLLDFRQSVEQSLNLPLTLNLYESQFYSRDGALNFSSTR